MAIEKNSAPIAYNVDTSLGRTARITGLLFLDLHGHAYDIGLLFFAASNLILGYLIVKSQYLPTVLGYALQLAGIVYLAGSYCRFLLTEYLASLQPAYIIPMMAELSFCLWLLAKGVKRVKQGNIQRVI